MAYDVDEVDPVQEIGGAPGPLLVRSPAQLELFEPDPEWDQTPGGFPQRGMAGPHLPVALTDDWLTPPELHARLGSFDLDPCASVGQPWPTAARQLTVHDDGLRQPWEGRVWMNPPYGRFTHHWMRRLADHGNGIALIFARTETAMFFDSVWARADAVLFIRGRLTFHRPDGTPGDFNGGAPSCLVAFHRDNTEVLAGLPDLGHLVVLR